MASSSSASPSPKSPEVSEKSKKYDRQLRLWGDHGQDRLEKSYICLINANATGTEILKSLVLPGCGRFMIVDNQNVTEEDIGNNFFLERSSLGKNRGECAKTLLLELNPEVHGESIYDPIETIMEQNPEFFKGVSVVIGSALSEKCLIGLSKTLWDAGIPFIFAQCNGLVGWIRVQLNEHPIVESHPAYPVEDLRLESPFPELKSYMNEIKQQQLTKEEAADIPWLVHVYKARGFHPTTTWSQWSCTSK